MEKTNFVEAVTERDIDIILLEELTVSVKFQKWFVSKVCDYDLDKIIGAWHSISDSRFGESDLVFLFLAKSGVKCAILIENKIDAVAQKDQSDRYKQRGEIGIRKCDWDEFITCIVSPSRYLETNAEAKKYQKKISYEKICEYFALSKNERHNFKNKMIVEAIEQNRRGYTITADGKVTDFWNKYFKFVQNNHPKLEMQEPGTKPSNSDWPDFRPKIFGKEMNIVHKLAKGVVDLQIFGMGNKLDELSRNLDDYINDEIELVKTGKSASLRITVPVIDRFVLFGEQIEKIKEALIAVEKLLNVGIEVKTKI